MPFDPFVQINPLDIFPTSSVQATASVSGAKIAVFAPPPDRQNQYLSASDANNLRDAIVALSSGTVMLSASDASVSAAFSSTIGSVSSAFSATIAALPSSSVDGEARATATLALSTATSASTTASWALNSATLLAGDIAIIEAQAIYASGAAFSASATATLASGVALSASVTATLASASAFSASATATLALTTASNAQAVAAAALADFQELVGTGSAPYDFLIMKDIGDSLTYKVQLSNGVFVFSPYP